MARIRYIITIFHRPTYLHFEYFLWDFLFAFDEEIAQCVVQFARKVTTILIFVLCVHKKIWVCHKTSSMSNLNNVYARSLQHVKFGRTPCNFIFMRNHVFFFHSWDVAAAVSRYLIIITGSFLYMVTRVSHTSFREGPEGKGEIFCELLA